MTKLDITCKKILDQINQSIHILVVPHKKPDGDAIGSALAMSLLLDQLGKRHRVFCLDPVSQPFQFLPEWDRVETDPKIFREKRFDLIVVLDSGDLNYSGIDRYLEKIDYPRPAIINIDHHSTSEFFGEINLVLADYSSTCQVLHDFIRKSNLILTKDIATCLLTGIITDTGGFTNPATTFDSLETASQLLLAGAKFYKINYNILKNKSIPSLKLWGNILSRLQKNEQSGIVSTFITLDDLDQYHVSDEALDGLANFLNNLDGARAVLVIKEHYNNKIKASLRTSDENLDVSRFAKIFGGGGHKKAAGFTIDGRLIKNGDEIMIA
ncbi:MAG TPA: DHH family phosphoesterase [Patescibacteria group bacterium]